MHSGGWYFCSRTVILPQNKAFVSHNGTLLLVIILPTCPLVRNNQMAMPTTRLIGKKRVAYRKLAVWLQIKQRSQLLTNERFQFLAISTDLQHSKVSQPARNIGYSETAKADTHFGTG
jgi:hypothetical protein